MPYIDKNSRTKLDKTISDLANLIQTSGEANYCIFKLMELYMISNTKSYSSISNCISIFECAKMEFYRRIAVSYEENKKEKNGDILENE